MEAKGSTDGTGGLRDEMLGKIQATLNCLTDAELCGLLGVLSEMASRRPEPALPQR